LLLIADDSEARANPLGAFSKLDGIVLGCESYNLEGIWRTAYEVERAFADRPGRAKNAEASPCN
jgi:hypothetical protein